MSTTTTRKPKPINRFPITLRIQAYETALDHGLHLVRDNFHLWAIRTPKTDGGTYDHVWICHSNSYDGLWRAAINTFRDPDFDPYKLPYSIGETAKQLTLYDPRTGDERKIDKKDLRSRRGQD